MDRPPHRRRADNPEGLLQKAGYLASGTYDFPTGRDCPAALALLHRAGEMERSRNGHLAERLRAANEAALALGVSPRDAARLALENPLLHSTTSRGLLGVQDVILEELTAAKASGSEERLMEIVHTGLRTAEKFHACFPRSISDELSAIELRDTLLATLSSDTLLPDGRSVAAWSVSSIGRRNYLDEFRRREDEVGAIFAADKTVTTYFQYYLAYGEEVALAQILPPQKPEK